MGMIGCRTGWQSRLLHGIHQERSAYDERRLLRSDQLVPGFSAMWRFPSWSAK